MNSLSYAIIIKNGIDIHLKRINTINKYIKSLSKKWLNIPLLSRTHGQAASPSTIGKELKVFTARTERELIKLKQVKPLAKFSGAVGNYHAFDIANNKINWPLFTKQFINTFGVMQNPITTQIEPHDWISEALQTISLSLIHI